MTIQYANPQNRNKDYTKNSQFILRIGRTKEPWTQILSPAFSQDFFVNLWTLAVRKQESDFLGGNKCWETGVCFFWGETGVRKQVSGYSSRKQVSGNRCLDSCWKQVSGNRCLVSCRKQVSGNRCLDSFWKQVSGNRCLDSLWKQVSGKQVSGFNCH